MVLRASARPVFVVRPRNKVVAAGRRLVVKCAVSGSPSPAVYWSNVDSQVGCITSAVLKAGGLTVGSAKAAVENYGVENAKNSGAENRTRRKVRQYLNHTLLF